MNWRILVGLVIWWFAMDAAIVYGGIWEARANPTANVEVALENGTILKGDLTRDWDRSMQLVLGDGSRVRVDKYQMMTFPRPLTSQSLWVQWRFLLPVLIVCAAFFTFVFIEVWGDRRNGRGIWAK